MYLQQRHLVDREILSLMEDVEWLLFFRRRMSPCHQCKRHHRQ